MPHEQALIDHVLQTSRYDGRVYIFEWERQPHFPENALELREGPPLELLTKIIPFMLDSTVKPQHYIEEKHTDGTESYVRDLSETPPVMFIEKQSKQTFLDVVLSY